MDAGGAWKDYAGEKRIFCNSSEGRTVGNASANTCASYGWGLTVNLLGLDLNWDFAQQWDFHRSVKNGFSTEFWIGRRF